MKEKVNHIEIDHMIFNSRREIIYRTLIHLRKEIEFPLSRRYQILSVIFGKRVIIV